MAPEVYKEEAYNDKADVFSFSIIAYELLHRYQMISATDGSFEECLVSGCWNRVQDFMVISPCLRSAW